MAQSTVLLIGNIYIYIYTHNGHQAFFNEIESL